jgi:hypothetical protein
MGFLTSRNRNVDERFSTIAADYMRIGDKLNIRWDIAFFQMMLETGNLSFKGVVSINQNNFAGLGATSRRVPGESFPDVKTGVQAHLEHLLLYAGVHLDNPVAERTRKVQEWGVLTNWQKTIHGPMTYDQLAKQWAPSARHYGREIAGLAETFYGSPCHSPDPNPELLALAKPGSVPAKSSTAADPKVVAMADAADPSNAPEHKLSGAELARRAVEEARKSGSFVRSSLGAESLVPPADEAKTVAVGEPAVEEKQPVKIINSAVASIDITDEPPKKTSGKKIQTAALGAGTKSAVLPGITAKSAMVLSPTQPKCKVWTASYGGVRSVIIKARADQQDNYTVLDVNEGSEKREAQAYIAAYAKGGKMVGEFTNPSQALDKAFELCPDG